ncbi:WXG100 family type VII secretion target [Actinomadura rubrisoli]|uniref:WXG100 family type VII secretion target n=1 Tax=Actinomadura rubrisoli TaxID=2530368 RepID=A0A4R5C1W0_9ACTN|nr:WXG100 family type VII secretion target [Actinomadura rubrisoli]TDD92509.1 WXG100 family type VII secretion target [Actinomadura rubrisoli]
MSRVKADPAQVEALARKVDEQGAVIGGLVGVLASAVSSMDWEGRSASRFDEAWHAEYRPMLERMRDSLEHDLSPAMRAFAGRVAAADGQI